MTSKPSVSQIWHDSWAVARARWYFRNADVGARVRVWGTPAITVQGTMIVGERVRLVSTIATTELVASAGAILEIGERTFINYGCSIAALQSVRIGPRCNIGSHVIIMDNDFHRLEPERRNDAADSTPIVLEENVWLGVRVIVLRGVTIGAGSVIAAGSVVTRSIPPRSLAAGQPAKVIRTL